MKKLSLILSLAVIAVIVIVAAGTPHQQTAPSEKPLVAATINPLYDITSNIAGDKVDVSLILPPGASPHTFEPTPATVKNLQDTQVVYAVGHGLDGWAEPVIESSGAQQITVDQGIALKPPSFIDEDEEEEGDGLDPHYWLTIPNAVIIAQNIEQDLSARFPEHADVFSANLDRYLAKLQTADDQIRAKLGAVQNKNLITLHDAWYYFAEDYGLNIVGTFEPTAGREPTPQYIADLTKAVQESGSTTLYSEPQLATQSIAGFVQDNNLNIVVLDPIGGSEGRKTYIDLMLYNAETIAKNQ